MPNELFPAKCQLMYSVLGQQQAAQRARTNVVTIIFLAKLCDLRPISDSPPSLPRQ